MRSNFYNNYKSKSSFEFLPEEMFVFKISSDKNLSTLSISKSIYKMFELPKNLISETVLPLFYKRIYTGDRRRIFRLLIQLQTSKNKAEIEFRSLLPKKGLCNFKAYVKSKLDAKGDVVFYATIFSITAAKKQQQTAIISNKHFRMALKTSKSHFWDWNLETNTVFYSSPSFKKIKQEQAAIFINSGCWNKIMHTDDLKKCYTEIQTHFENQETVYEKSFMTQTSGKNYKWVLVRAKVIKRKKDGKPLRIMATHTDITNQKEKELELTQTLQSYSEHNNRLLNFSHIVSHNLNSHSGNIKQLLDLIESEENILSSKEYLNYLRIVSNDLNATITDLSQIVRIQNNLNSIKEPLDLILYLEKNEQTINNYGLENKITIVNKVPKGSIINFNSAYLESILLNFTTNAVKYAHPDRKPIITFDFFTENKKKILTINDNGLGIDLEKHGNLLFGLYKTFHKHEDAHGIGLYITKNQIESMNGQISVESKIGEGTTFKIIFNE